jgi:hypothetical protein
LDPTHYRAMKIVRQACIPDAQIVRLFVARRVFSNPFETDDG